MAISKEKKAKVQQFAHILAGVIILIHGYEKYELHESSALIFFMLGIIFLLIAALHHRLVARFHFVDSIFLIIEAVCYSVIAYDYFHAGKIALPWCYVFVCLAYITAAGIKYRKSAHSNHT